MEIPRKDKYAKSQLVYSTSCGSHDGYDMVGCESSSFNQDQYKSDLLLHSSSPIDLKSFDTHSFNTDYKMSPLPCLPGEDIINHTDFLNGLILLTNYRLVILCYSYSFQRHLVVEGDLPNLYITEKVDQQPIGESQFSRKHVSLGKPTCTHFIPLDTILKADIVDLVLKIFSKTGGLIKIPFADTLKCSFCLNCIVESMTSCKMLKKFAFTFKSSLNQLPESSFPLKRLFLTRIRNQDADAEFKRLKFPKQFWKLTDVNENYEVCSTYSVRHILPRDFPTQNVRNMAPFRQGNRFPSIVWRSKTTGAVMLRCAQPCVGLTGCRNEWDENFVSAVLANCQNDAKQLRPDKVPERLLVVDARHYSAAFYNYFRGGGFENVQYYKNIDIVWKNLPNIHVIRSSFEKLMVCIHSSNDQWFSALESTDWLNYLGAILKASYDVVQTLHNDGTPVMIHCTDGWDRTTQLTSLSQLMLDPYYRTFEGFRTLIEREWIDFGYKFGDRNGLNTTNMDPYEISPIFLQFLDCVHQLRNQYPEEFEFNTLFLIKMALHTYSGLFGTFLCNSVREQTQYRISELTCSIWSFLNPETNRFIRNYLFNPTDQILVPLFSKRDLMLWREVYCNESLAFENAIAKVRGDMASPSRGASDSSPTPDHRPPYPLPRRISIQDLQNESMRSYSSFEAINEVELAKINEVNLATCNLEIPASSDNIPFVHDLLNSPAILNCNASDVHTQQDCELDNINDNQILTISTETLTDDLPVNVDYTKDVGPYHFPHTTEYISNERKSTSRSSSFDPPVAKPRGHASSAHILSSNEMSSIFVTDSQSRQFQLYDEYGSMKNPLSNAELESEYEKLSEKYFSRPEIPLCNELCIFLNSPSSSSCSSSSAESLGDISQDWDGLPMIWRRIDPSTLYISRLHQSHSIERAHWAQHFAELQEEIEALRLECQCLKQKLPNEMSHQIKSSSPAVIENDDSGQSITNCIMDVIGSERSRVSSESSETGSFINVVSPGMPEWLPDYMATNCGLCQANFYFANRKHHCRNCGYIFCHECSKNSICIPHLQIYKPCRVCNKCFEKLQSTDSLGISKSPSTSKALGTNGIFLSCLENGSSRNGNNNTLSNSTSGNEDRHSINSYPFNHCVASPRTCKSSAFDCEGIKSLRSVSSAPHHKNNYSMAAHA